MPGILCADSLSMMLGTGWQFPSGLALCLSAVAFRREWNSPEGAFRAKHSRRGRSRRIHTKRYAVSEPSARAELFPKPCTHTKPKASTLPTTPNQPEGAETRNLKPPKASTLNGKPLKLGMLPLVLTVLDRDHSRGYDDPYQGPLV